MFCVLVRPFFSISITLFDCSVKNILLDKQIYLGSIYYHVLVIVAILQVSIFRNKSDPDGLIGEEEELIEVTVEALTTIIQHPHTYKYKNLVKKYAAQILYKFEKILETETTQQEMNKVVYTKCWKILNYYLFFRMF